MFLLGTLANGIMIVIGSLLGKLLQHIPEKMKNTSMQAIGLVVVVLGLQMGFKSSNILLILISLVFGALIGEYWDIEGKLNCLGKWIERKFGKDKSEGNISQAFVSSTLIFVIGAMAIIGGLDSGLRGDHGVLYTKAIIDGFTAFILTTTLGIGVLFSAIPVLLYEGTIALLATQIDRFISHASLELLINEITAVGGVMILAIGLNMMGITKTRVANLLPGLLIAAILSFFM